jgi:hypothetical protein
MASQKRPDWSRPLPAPLQILDGDKPILTLATVGDVRDLIVKRLARGKPAEKHMAVCRRPRARCRERRRWRRPVGCAAHGAFFGRHSMPPKLTVGRAHPCACTRRAPNTIPAAAMPMRIERIRMWWSSMANDSKKSAGGAVRARAAAGDVRCRLIPAENAPWNWIGTPESSPSYSRMRQTLVIAGTLIGCLAVWLFCMTVLGGATTETPVAEVTMPSLGAPASPSPSNETSQLSDRARALSSKQPCTIWRCG